MNKFFIFLSASLFFIGGFSSNEVFGNPSSLPRFAAIRYNEVNLRTGPGHRFPINWVYVEKHYPVEIIDEYELWRQIREADGTIGWVHKNMLTNQRYAVTLQEDTLFRKPQETSDPIAIAQKGTIAHIEKCPSQSDFCLLKFPYREKYVTGWMKKASFFGVYPQEVID